MQVCKCYKPKLPENARGGIAGNVCQLCGDKVEPFPPLPSPPSIKSSIGSTIIAMQDAMERTEFRSDQEASEFSQYLVKTTRESLRQKLGVWRSNRKCEEIDNAA